MISYSDNPISLRSKKWLTNALFELMEEKPYDKISIREISEKAGLTRQTFYHNFSSKEMLLIYRSDQLFSEFFEYIQKNNISNMQDIMILFFKYWQEHKEFLEKLTDNNMQHVLTHRFPEYFRKLNLLNVEELLNETQQEYVYSFFSGAVIHLLCNWVEKGMTCGPKEMSMIVQRILKGEFYRDERSNKSNTNQELT